MTDLEPFVVRKQSEKNRQSSTQNMELTPQDIIKIDNVLKANVDLYQHLIDKGAARECARSVLPLCTQTVLYMTGTIRSWIHYLMLRTKPDTQLEHREIAEQIREMFKKHFPNISSALDWN